MHSPPGAVGKNPAPDYTHTAHISHCILFTVKAKSAKDLVLYTLASPNFLCIEWIAIAKKKKKVEGQAQKFIGHVSLHPEVGCNMVDGCPPSFPHIILSIFGPKKPKSVYPKKYTKTSKTTSHPQSH